MKKMSIYEPAMCCPTGLCGVDINPDLLRISTVVSVLNKQGIVVERYSLASAPMKFVTNQAVNKLINEDGIDALPATEVDGGIVITGRYPTNEEIAKLLGLPISLIDGSENYERQGSGCQ